MSLGIPDGSSVYWAAAPSEDFSEASTSRGEYNDLQSQITLETYH